MYLYHPVLGTTELSEETTHRALGSWIFGLSAENVVQGRISSITPPNQGQYLKPNQSKTLESGVFIDRVSLSVAEAKNYVYGWAAIKTSEGGPYLVPPKSRFFDSNLYRLVHNITTALWGSGSSILSTDDTVSFELEQGTVETYRSTWRLLPKLLDFYARHELPIIVGAVVGDQINELHNTLIRGIGLRNEKDRSLSEKLEQLDMALQIMDGVKTFISLVDLGIRGGRFQPRVESRPTHIP